MKTRELRTLKKANEHNDQVYSSNISALTKMTKRNQSLFKDYKHTILRDQSLKSEDIRFEEGLIDKIGADFGKKVIRRVKRIRNYAFS